MSEVTQHFVTFYSPGTFFAEDTTKPIDSWDVPTAVKMSKSIVERYDARPYGFRFTTRSRGPKDLDSKEIAESPMHFLGGKIETVIEIERRNDPKESILLSNMKCNNWPRIVRSTGRWSWCQPLRDKDVVLDI